MKNLNYILFLFTICSFGQGAIKNPKTIRGFVFDYRGIPAGDAAISIRNCLKTVADKDGKFVIDAKEGEVLNISCNGWQSEVVITDKNCYTVHLPEPMGLVITTRKIKRWEKKIKRKVKRKAPRELQKTL